MLPNLNKCYVIPSDFGAIGDGAIDDTTALQESIDHAIQNKKVLNLCSKTYRIDGTLYIKDDITIESGEIVSFGNPNGVAIIAQKAYDEYITIVVRDLILKSNGGANKIGFNLILGLRCVFENCTITDFWNGERNKSLGMLVEGCVGCSFISCDWYRNDVLIEIKGRQRKKDKDGILLPTTDSKFWSCRFQKSKSKSIFISGNAHNNGWHGCWIEHSVFGPLVVVENGRYNSFYDCRLEDPGIVDFLWFKLALPTVIIRKSTNGNNRDSNSNRVVNCIFSNTQNAGIVPLILLQGPNFNPDFPTVLMGNHFPTSSSGAVILGSTAYRSVANSILADN